MTDKPDWLDDYDGTCWNCWNHNSDFDSSNPWPFCGPCSVLLWSFAVDRQAERPRGYGRKEQPSR